MTFKLRVKKNASIEDLLKVYACVLNVIEDESDERLVRVLNSLRNSLDQLQRIRESSVDKKLERNIVSGLKQGVVDLPLILDSVVPENAKEIVSRIQMNVDALA